MVTGGGDSGLVAQSLRRARVVLSRVTVTGNSAMGRDERSAGARNLMATAAEWAQHILSTGAVS